MTRAVALSILIGGVAIADGTERFDMAMGNGGRLDGSLACTGRCCDVHHEGSNIMRTDLLKICFDERMRVVSLLVEAGGP